MFQPENCRVINFETIEFKGILINESEFKEIKKTFDWMIFWEGELERYENLEGFKFLKDLDDKRNPQYHIFKDFRPYGVSNGEVKDTFNPYHTQIQFINTVSELWCYAKTSEDLKSLVEAINKNIIYPVLLNLNEILKVWDENFVWTVKNYMREPK